MAPKYPANVAPIAISVMKPRKSWALPNISPIFTAPPEFNSSSNAVKSLSIFNIVYSTFIRFEPMNRFELIVAFPFTVKRLVVKLV